MDAVWEPLLRCLSAGGQAPAGEWNHEACPGPSVTPLRLEGRSGRREAGNADPLAQTGVSYLLEMEGKAWPAEAFTGVSAISSGHPPERER